MRAVCEGEVMVEGDSEQQQQQQQQQASVFGQMMTPALAGQCAFVSVVRSYICETDCSCFK
jgi:hypothetical protein